MNNYYNNNIINSSQDVVCHLLAGCYGTLHLMEKYGATDVALLMADSGTAL